MRKIATLSELDETQSYSRVVAIITGMMQYPPSVSFDKQGTTHAYHWGVPSYGVTVDFFPKGRRYTYMTQRPKVLVYYDTANAKYGREAVSRLKQVLRAKKVSYEG